MSDKKSAPRLSIWKRLLRLIFVSWSVSLLFAFCLYFTGLPFWVLEKVLIGSGFNVVGVTGRLASGFQFKSFYDESMERRIEFRDFTLNYGSLFQVIASKRLMVETLSLEKLDYHEHRLEKPSVFDFEMVVNGALEGLRRLSLRPEDGLTEIIVRKLRIGHVRYLGSLNSDPFLTGPIEIEDMRISATGWSAGKFAGKGPCLEFSLIKTKEEKNKLKIVIRIEQSFFSDTVKPYASVRELEL